MTKIEKSIKLFNKLKKHLPDLRKETISLFELWWKDRESLKKDIKDQIVTHKRILQFKEICNKFLNFVESNSTNYKKYKIQYLIMVKYLEKDIEYCNKELVVMESIDSVFISKKKEKIEEMKK